MINFISENQICQAFDPMLILPEKTRGILDDHMRANTSCVAPAYVYMEGSRGKRFLCDYHYYYEKSIVLVRTPEQWASIEEYLVDKIEDIKLTFAKVKTNIIQTNTLCWCSAKAYVKCINRANLGIQYLCNFHYRKMYYRFLSNNVDYFSVFDVIDERYKMDKSIHEEYENLPIY